MAAARFAFNLTHAPGTEAVIPTLEDDENDELYRGLQQTVASSQKIVLAALERPAFCPTLSRLAADATPLTKMIHAFLHRTWFPKCYGTDHLCLFVKSSVGILACSRLFFVVVVDNS